VFEDVNSQISNILEAEYFWKTNIWGLWLLDIKKDLKKT